MLRVCCAPFCSRKPCCFFTNSLCTCTHEISASLQDPHPLKQNQQEISFPLQEPHSFKQKQQVHPLNFKQIQAFAAVLQNAENFSTVRIAHHIILQDGYASKRLLCNLLIDLYGKCGALQDAFNTFHSLQKKNVFTWNILFCILVQHKQSLQALQLFNQMLVEGLMPDKFTYSTMVDACALMDTLYEGTLVHCRLAQNDSKSHVVVATALIKLYSKHGLIGHVKLAFDQVSEHDTVSWSAMIEAHAKPGYEIMAIHLFQQMQKESVKLDPVALVTVLGACATASALTWGKIFHSVAIESRFELDLLVGNALVNMYAKCGDSEDGSSVFKEMHLRDVISWTAMISAYTQAGLVQEASQLFAAMQEHGVRPNEITFVNILSACSHEGMIKEGIFYFALIYGNCMTPTSQHYGCLIDLFGRAGQLEEAELLLNNTEIQHSAEVWQALLGACKAHNDVERGKRVAECTIDLDPSMCAAYAALLDFILPIDS